MLEFWDVQAAAATEDRNGLSAPLAPAARPATMRPVAIPAAVARDLRSSLVRIRSVEDRRSARMQAHGQA
jgi:hypothetical protein